MDERTDRGRGFEEVPKMTGETETTNRTFEGFSACRLNTNVHSSIIA